MAHTAKAVAIGNALVTYLSSNLSSLSLVSGSPALASSMADQPVYPCNPLTQLPRLDVLIPGWQIVPGPPQTASDGTYTYELWYYRKQTAGQSHQALLLADVETICNLFVGNWRPTSLDAISGQKNLKILSLQVAIPAELQHPLQDAAALRVSVAQIVLTIESRSQG